MTMTQFAPHTPGPWTLEELAELPEDGVRTELIEGSLLVSPIARVNHARTVTYLRRVLDGQAPDGLVVAEGANVVVGSTSTYFIPDLWVADAASLDKDSLYLDSTELRLVVEVVSPSSAGIDRITKRHFYAKGRIPRYWIVDPKRRTLTVLALDGDDYRDDAVVEAGQVWRTDQPFPLTLDPADFC